MSLHSNSFSLCVPTLSGKRMENFMSWLRASSMKRFIPKWTESVARKRDTRAAQRLCKDSIRSHLHWEEKSRKFTKMMLVNTQMLFLELQVWPLQNGKSLSDGTVEFLQRMSNFFFYCWCSGWENSTWMNRQSERWERNEARSRVRKWMCCISKPKQPLIFKVLCWLYGRPSR